MRFFSYLLLMTSPPPPSPSPKSPRSSPRSPPRPPNTKLAVNHGFQDLDSTDPCSEQKERLIILEKQIKTAAIKENILEDQILNLRKYYSKYYYIAERLKKEYLALKEENETLLANLSEAERKALKELKAREAELEAAREALKARAASRAASRSASRAASRNPSTLQPIKESPPSPVTGGKPKKGNRRGKK